MYFYNLIKEMAKDKNIRLYVDMDGVISSYNFGCPLNFKTKRPLTTNINTLSKIKELDNVELYILSVCRKKSEVDDKNNWLDKYASFFDKENRIIIDRESYDYSSSSLLKLNYLKSIDCSDTVILVDDDNLVLKTIHEELPDIILYQDSELID